MGEVTIDCGCVLQAPVCGELLMSIHGSALADSDLVDAIEDVMCHVCMHAPTYAVDLVQHAGTCLIWYTLQDC